MNSPQCFPRRGQAPSLMFHNFKLIWEVLERAEQKRFLLLIVLSLLMAPFEMVGVAAIFPFLALVGDPALITENRAFAVLSQTLAITEPKRFTAVVGLFVLLVLIAGMGVRALGAYAQTHFAMMRGRSIARRLLSGHLHQPYAWHLGQKSVDLSQSLLSEVDLVVQQSILPSIMLLTNVAVTMLIAGVLFVVSPVAATSATFLLLSVYGAVILGLRRPLQRAGAKRVQHNQLRFRQVTEIGEGIKELKASGRETIALNGFRAPAKAMAEAHTSAIVLGQMPKFALEAVIYGGFVALVLASYASGSAALGQLMPLFGLFGMASLKLFPALQQIFADLSLMRFSQEALMRLHSQLSQQTGVRPDAVVQPLGLRQRIEMEHVSYSFAGASRPALRDVSLCIPVGTTLGVVGGTGAGKSTLVDILLGLLPPEGAVRVDGVPLEPSLIRRWQRNIGYVPQAIFLSDDTISANIAFGVPADQIDQNAVEAAARVAQLHSFITQQLPGGYAGRIGEGGVRLSGGQRQRIGLARALYHDPDILVLDEATSALDGPTEQAVMSAISALEGRKTIIMIAHRLATVRSCDRIIMLGQGRVVASGTYDELLEENEAFGKLALA